MFDLFRSQKKAVRITLSVLLGLVGLSMVTYLIPTSGQDDTGVYTDTSVVAKVGKDDLTAQAVTKAVRNMTQSRQLPADLLTIYVPQIIQQMISDRALAYEAGRVGLKVSGDEVDNAILDSLPADLVKDGKVDSTTFNAVLQQQGITMQELKADTERQLLIGRLRQTVAQGVFVSPREIETEYHRRNDKVKLEYALVAPAKYQTEAEPTDAELKAYYDAHKAAYKTMEKRTLAVIALTPGGASKPPDEDLLRKDYTASLDKYRTPDRVQVRHLLVKSDATNDAAMKAKAEGLLKQIQGGGDFAKLAQANSDDPGSKDKGGELGFVVKGQTVPEFEKAAFSLQPGQTSGLVKTTYGYHILQVEKHDAARVAPYEEVRPQLINDYLQRMAADEIQKNADKASAELRKDPMHPEKAAAAVGAMVTHVDNWQVGDPIPSVGVSKELSDALAALHKGEATTGPVVIQGNREVVATVLDYQPARQATLDEAKAEVRTGARDEKLQKILTQKASDLALRTQALNGDLQKAGKEMGIEVKTSSDVDRQGAIEGVGTASTLADAFSKPVGSVIGPLVVPGGRVFAKVVGKTDADLSGLGAQTVSLRDELKAQKARDRSQLFEEGLKKRLQDEGKLKIRQDVITRLVQTYSNKS